jgi:hypothetical protein
MVEKPLKVLYQFGTNSQFAHTISKSLYSNWDRIHLTEFYENYAVPRVIFPAVKYVVNSLLVETQLAPIFESQSSSAEKEGFEPPVPRGTTVFKTAAIDHSAISPGAKVLLFLYLVTIPKK